MIGSCPVQTPSRRTEKIGWGEFSYLCLHIRSIKHVFILNENHYHWWNPIDTDEGCLLSVWGEGGEEEGGIDR